MTDQLPHGKSKTPAVAFRTSTPEAYFRELRRIALEQDRKAFSDVVNKFSDVLERLPRIRKEIESFYSSDQISDYVALALRIEPLLALGEKFVKQLNNIPSDICGEKEIVEFSRGTCADISLQNIKDAVKAFEALCISVRKRLIEEEAARKLAEEEAARKRIEEEEARKRAEDKEARERAEEEERRRKEKTRNWYISFAVIGAVLSAIVLSFVLHPHWDKSASQDIGFIGFLIGGGITFFVLSDESDGARFMLSAVAGVVIGLGVGVVAGGFAWILLGAGGSIFGLAVGWIVRKKIHG